MVGSHIYDPSSATSAACLDATTHPLSHDSISSRQGWPAMKWTSLHPLQMYEMTPTEHGETDAPPNWRATRLIINLVVIRGAWINQITPEPSAQLGGVVGELPVGIPNECNKGIATIHRPRRKQNQAKGIRTSPHHIGSCPKHS